MSCNRHADCAAGGGICFCADLSSGLFWLCEAKPIGINIYFYLVYAKFAWQPGILPGFSLTPKGVVFSFLFSFACHVLEIALTSKHVHVLYCTLKGELFSFTCLLLQLLVLFVSPLCVSAI